MAYFVAFLLQKLAQQNIVFKKKLIFDTALEVFVNSIYK